jgi:DNA-binding transcriptional LysR family regulator
MICEDELLVRTPTGYELTPHAQVLRDELTMVMPGLRAMFERAPFEPHTATNTSESRLPPIAYVYMHRSHLHIY